MSEFSMRFKKLKEYNGLTLKEMSEDLGITSPNLSYYMKGREPNYDVLIKIADYFNVSTDYLLGRTEYKNSQEEAERLLLQEKIKESGKYNLDNVSQEDISNVQAIEKKFSEALYKTLFDNNEEIIPHIEDLAYIILGSYHVRNSKNLEVKTQRVRAMLVLLQATENYFHKWLFGELQEILLDNNVSAELKNTIIDMIEVFFVSPPMYVHVSLNTFKAHQYLD